PEKITDVGNPRVHNQLAEAYGGLGRWEEAEKSAAYSRHLGPTQPGPYLMLGAVQFNHGQADRAALSLLEALLIDPAGNGSNDAVWQQLKLCYETLGQKDAIMDGTVDLPNGGKRRQLTLNINTPFMVGQITRASNEVIHLLITAQVYASATAFRSMMTTGQFGFLEAVLDPVPPSAP